MAERYQSFVIQRIDKYWTSLNAHQIARYIQLVVIKLFKEKLEFGQLSFGESKDQKGLLVYRFSNRFGNIEKMIAPQRYSFDQKWILDDTRKLYGFHINYSFPHKLAPANQEMFLLLKFKKKEMNKSKFQRQVENLDQILEFIMNWRRYLPQEKIYRSFED
jgi:hypothetical protein